MEYLSVPQVADELKVNYQKVLYMIRTGKLPAEKLGRAFQIPANYQELMGEGRPRKKRSPKNPALKGKPGRPKKQQAAISPDKDALGNNLAKAIQDLVSFQVSLVLGKKK